MHKQTVLVRHPRKNAAINKYLCCGVAGRHDNVGTTSLAHKNHPNHYLKNSKELAL